MGHSNFTPRAISNARKLSYTTLLLAALSLAATPCLAQSVGAEGLETAAALNAPSTLPNAGTTELGIQANTSFEEPPADWPFLGAVGGWAVTGLLVAGSLALPCQFNLFSDEPSHCPAVTMMGLSIAVAPFLVAGGSHLGSNRQGSYWASAGGAWLGALIGVTAWVGLHYLGQGAFSQSDGVDFALNIIGGTLTVSGVVTGAVWGTQRSRRRSPAVENTARLSFGAAPVAGGAVAGVGGSL
jgi:hypothetical protein